jgi:ADP-ribose pyrophosphatase YjhB (NUDIX family)
MSLSVCPKGCCKFSITYYDPIGEEKMIEWIKEEKKKGIIRKKAGIFFYDPKIGKVLLVQSHGKFWGSPKGTKEENETYTECAIREVKEETGIEIDEDNLSDYIQVKNTRYYVMSYPECNVNVQTTIENNDANGIGWFSYDCLNSFVNEGKMVLNNHFRTLAKKVLNRNYN